MPQSIKVESTPEELKNGWSNEQLQAYIARQNEAALRRIFGDPSKKKPRRLIVQNTRTFNPHRW